MPRSRVFILYSHPLFARGVESLLSREDGLEIVGVEREGPGALEKIRELLPDVILVDSEASAPEHSLSLSEIFRQMPGARVVNLSLRGNDIDIYHRHRIVATRPEHLLRAIGRRDERRAAGG